LSAGTRGWFGSKYRYLLSRDILRHLIQALRGSVCRCARTLHGPFYLLRFAPLSRLAVEKT